MVGGAGGGAVRAREVLAGLDQHPGEPLALSGEHVGFDVIARHHGAGRAGAKAGQRGSEECRGGLAHHRRLGGGLLETREERAGIELQALAGAPVQAAVHGDQPGSPLQVAEGLVERLITELRAGPPTSTTSAGAGSLSWARVSPARSSVMSPLLSSRHRAPG